MSLGKPWQLGLECSFSLSVVTEYVESIFWEVGHEVEFVDRKGSGCKQTIHLKWISLGNFINYIRDVVNFWVQIFFCQR